MASLKLKEIPMGPKVIDKRNFFHFRDAAFPKYNDLIFRKRLMNSSWRFRKKVLTQLKGFFATNKEFDSSNLDADAASLKRDYILMFGTKDEIKEQLAQECRCLPMHQKPNYHEKYALITELARLNIIDDRSVSRSSLKVSPTDSMSNKLAILQDFLDRNTPTVTNSWQGWFIQNSIAVGSGFATNSEDVAKKLLEEVEEARAYDERGDELPHALSGYRALDFLGKDPLLDDPKFKKQENELITYILEMVEVADEKVVVNAMEPEDYEMPTGIELIGDTE